MRYLMTLGAALAVILLLSAALACGGNGGDDDRRGDDARTAENLSPDDPEFRATVDAAQARIGATRTAREAAVASGQGDRPAPTDTPAAAPIAVSTRPRPMPTIAPPTPTPGAPAAGPANYELSAVRNWDYANQEDPAATARISSIGWIADGLQSAGEFNAAEYLVNIAIDAPDTLNAILDAHAVAQRLGPLDLPALLSLQRMAQNRPQRLAQLTAAPWFRDGLTETEAAIVAILYGRAGFQSPEFDDIVGDPNILNVVVSATAGAGAVGGSGAVPVVVIRSGPPPPGSPVLAAAQIAVPVYEEMFQAPLPTPAIIIHITPFVAGFAAGTNYQTHITLKPEIDAGERPDFARHAVFHEIAHYYLYARPGWYAEGGADFAASYAEYATRGAPIAATNSPCAGAASISELERRLPDDDDDNGGGGANDPDDAGLWRCNYALGERLLLALYRELGEERFLQGWRALYAELIQQPGYPSQRKFAADDLRIAWLRAGGMTAQPALEHIWDQWYRGSADRAVAAPPDTTPVDPYLPAVQGYIDAAYIALNQMGEPVTSFPARDVDDFVYLTLEYSYSYAGAPQELTFEVAEYYQDGFSAGGRSLTVTMEPQHIGGTQWVSVGPSPPASWAPGRYWVYVYEGGRKIAEVSFEVTP